MLVLGDFNGDLGDSLGDKGKYPPNQRGSKLLDFANYFNLCSANLLSNCDEPLETYISDCGRHKSTLDYIFVPNCLLGNMISCKTFDMQIENTSDHLPITLELNYPTSSLDIIADDLRLTWHPIMTLIGPSFHKKRSVKIYHSSREPVRKY